MQSVAVGDDSCASVFKLVSSVDEGFLVIPIDAVILVVYWLFFLRSLQNPHLLSGKRRPIGSGCRSEPCLPVTTVAQVRPQAILYEICGGHSATGTGLFPSTSGFPYQYHSANAPLILLLLSEGQAGKKLDLSKNQCCFGNREALRQKVLSLDAEGKVTWAHTWSFTRTY